MRKLDRRDFLQMIGALGMASVIPVGLKNNSAFAAELGSDLVLTLNVFGAWDVSSFCDPKLNTPLELPINNWASGISEIPKAGNIPYAPIWDNAAFFEKYYQDMLVINCVDAQTNSHSTGQVVAFSGRAESCMGWPIT